MPIQQMMLGSGASTDPVYIDDIFSTDLWESHTDRNEIIANGVKLGNANKGGSVYFNGTDYKDYIKTEVRNCQLVVLAIFSLCHRHRNLMHQNLHSQLMHL